jgi:hypothetical protein
VLWLAAAGAHAQTLLGPVPYLCADDSPFNLSGLGETVFLEDFEDLLLNVPGVTAPMGTPIGPGGLTDSVDCDDGATDGSGTLGRSFFSGSGHIGIRFTFSADPFGRLPTHAGIVWTDGGGQVTFSAFDAAGELLGQVGPVNIPDGGHSGGTTEDRFFGIRWETGVGAIEISKASGGIEVDHLQYGVIGCGPDWNSDGAVNSNDFFAFLTDYFDGSADFNNDALTNSNDFFAFLTAFFEGC